MLQLVVPEKVPLSKEVLDALDVTEDEAREALGVYIFGPTWQRNPDGSWRLPDRTLGWQIAAWCTKWLRNPDDDTKPWMFTPEQLRFVLWWYAVDKGGRFIYRKSVLQRLKGWGKDPLLAVLCLVELVGPSRFKEWTDKGDPVGTRHKAAWVQVAAVNKDQSKNTMTMLPALMSDAFMAEFQVERGEYLIRAFGGKVRLEAVTSNYRALEGARATFVVANETHQWIQSNRGHDMWRTIDGNITKKSNRVIAITNAYLPGEESVGELVREAYEKAAESGEAWGTMYDSIEAGPKARLTGPLLHELLKIVRGDAVWINPVDVEQSIADPVMGIARGRRMWLNQVVADADSLHSPATWDPLMVEAALQPGQEIVLGFDGGISDDATALVAIRVHDRIAFVLHLQEKPDGPAGEDWEVDAEAANSAVHQAMLAYKVKGFYSDVAGWETYVVDWTSQYGEQMQAKAKPSDPIRWDMRRNPQRSTEAHERLMRALYDGKLLNDGDPRLRRHALNAVRRVNPWGVNFGKAGGRESRRKVDAYTALLLANEAYTDLITKPVRGSTDKRPGRVWAF